MAELHVSKFQTLLSVHPLHPVRVQVGQTRGKLHTEFLARLTTKAKLFQLSNFFHELISFPQQFC